MAKQIGEIRITGTICDITFYRMEGEYYARKKSSLKGSRVKKDPRFKRTMESARRLALGSQLASRVYRSLPREERVYALYKELKSLAIRGLKGGESEAEVMEGLWHRLGAAGGGNCTEQPKKEDGRKRGTARCALYAVRRNSSCIKELSGALPGLFVNARGKLVDGGCVQSMAGEPRPG